MWINIVIINVPYSDTSINRHVVSEVDQYRGRIASTCIVLKIKEVTNNVLIIDYSEIEMASHIVLTKNRALNEISSL